MTTIKIYATKDSDGFYYYRNGSKTRTGGYTYGFGGRTGTESNNQYYFFARFNIDALVGKHITAVRYSAIRDGSESNSGTISIHGGIAPTGAFSDVAGCGIADTRQMPTGSGDARIDWDVTQQVLALLNAGDYDIYGVLWNTAHGSYTAFMTAHQASQNNRPYLEADYEDGTVGYQHTEGLYRCQVYYRHTEGLRLVEPYYMSANGLRRISI
jgi:hypothetical protein